MLDRYRLPPSRVRLRRYRHEALLTTLLILLVLPACTHTGAPQPAVVLDDGFAGVDAPVRCLFRVHVRDGERDGRFRLVLWEDAAGFRLAASDAIGRGLWIYDQYGQSGVWIDRRRDSLCRLRGEVALQVEEFGEVPVEAIPALLRGRHDQVASELVPESFESGARLRRDDRSLAWDAGHCEVADGPRPSLERYADWPENCAVEAGSGE